MKVVIFDDELHERQAMYRGAGLELLFFAHADDAVLIAERERPDVVLMDFSMHAERSGADAVAALATLRQKKKLPLRMIAISTDPEANQRMLNAGADDAVPKTHVRGYLRKLLEEKRLADLHDIG